MSNNGHTSFAVVKWDEISRAIGQAKEIGELNILRAKIETIRVLAKQSRQSLETQNRIAEFRLRIDRKRGTWLADNIERGGDRKSGSKSEQVTLKEAGFSRQESHILQRLASIPEEEFERHLDERRESNQEITTAGLLKLQLAIKYANREAPPLPKGRYTLIYADPPFRYEFSHTHIRKVEEVYPTLSLEQICAMGPQIQKVSSVNCTLLLWVPSSHLDKFPAILDSWGFRFCTSWVWNKVKGNFSFYGSISHEMIIIGGKGSSVPTCDPKTVQSILSVQSIRKTRHSAKPEHYYEIIETLWPKGRYLELFSRCTKPRKGWTYWGDEVGERREEARSSRRVKELA